jgi:hypothetical protein
MPIWKITEEGPIEVDQTELEQENLLEEHLEDWIEANHALLGEQLLIIGRQVLIPDVNDRIDLLGLDPQGNAVIIELKRGKLTDPVDMQALRYASYVSKWSFEDFERQARVYSGRVGDSEYNFNDEYEGFCAEAGVDDVPDINTDQRIVIVGSEVRAKLGSVALWLLEHNVDIKVVEIEMYREGETLFIQPQVIIPLPVSRFSETGRAKTTEGTRPWKDSGRSWHLDKRCSPTTREMMLNLNDLILKNFAVEGPRWRQKFYVAYRVGNRNWLTVRTHASLLRLRILVEASRFDETELADRLEVKVYDQEESLSKRLGWPSSVLIENRSEDADRVNLRIKKNFDLDSDHFLGFLKEAYETYSNL